MFVVVVAEVLRENKREMSTARGNKIGGFCFGFLIFVNQKDRTIMCGCNLIKKGCSFNDFEFIGGFLISFTLRDESSFVFFSLNYLGDF